jgi:pimeloyl-ACP methyl ester carboxylesterase
MAWFHFVNKTYSMLVYCTLFFLSVAVLVTVAGCVIARKAAYPAPNIEVPSPPPAPIEEIVIEDCDEQVIAWLLRFEGGDESTPVLLAFHGNGENLETMHRAETIERLNALKAHVFAVDYPGYGRSTGSPNETSVVRAADVALASLRSRFPKNPVIVWGWSLGAGVAAQVASRNTDKIGGLILISPWTTLPATAKLHYPAFLVALFMRDEYDTLAAAPRIKAPALVIHGELDDLIPASQGKEVADAFHNLKLWFPVKGAGHNDVLSVEEVWRKMDWFIQSLKKI